MTPEEKLEQQGKRLHLMLYAIQDPTPEYTEWRNDLECTIQDFAEAYKNYKQPFAQLTARC